MATRRSAGGVVAMSAALLLGVAGCGDDNKTSGTPQTTVEGDNLKLDIQSATLPASGPPTVTFRVTDLNGTPFNLDAELAATTTFPRTTGPRFTLAMLDDNGDYVSYYATTTAPKAYTYVPDPEIIGTGTFVPPTPASRTQAQTATFSKTTLKNLGNGVYEWTFPAPNVTTGLDRTKTHTVAGWITRNLGETTTSAGGSFNFVPAGGTAQKLETVTDAACNRCHGQLTAHGTRRNTQFCITCHSPQTGDPETDRTVDFKVMIHKIHRGNDLPSVQGGNPYYIVGYNQGVTDWSTGVFPWHDHGVAHCTVCHQGEDKDNWKTKPTAAVCTSCHDNVKFGSEATVFCNDPNLKPGQNCNHVVAINVTPANEHSTSLCASCHAAGSSVAPIDSFHHGD